MEEGLLISLVGIRVAHMTISLFGNVSGGELGQLYTKQGQIQTLPSHVLFLSPSFMSSTQTSTTAVSAPQNLIHYSSNARPDAAICSLQAQVAAGVACQITTVNAVRLKATYTAQSNPIGRLPTEENRDDSRCVPCLHCEKIPRLSDNK
jgi:hypothetical protein